MLLPGVLTSTAHGESLTGYSRGTAHGVLLGVLTGTHAPVWSSEARSVSTENVSQFRQRNSAVGVPANKHTHTNTQPHKLARRRPCVGGWLHGAAVVRRAHAHNQTNERTNKQTSKQANQTPQAQERRAECPEHRRVLTGTHGASRPCRSGGPLRGTQAGGYSRDTRAGTHGVLMGYSDGYSGGHSDGHPDRTAEGTVGMRARTCEYSRSVSSLDSCGPQMGT